MRDVSTEAATMPLHPSPLPKAACAVVFAPHADDEVLGCGATLHRLHAQGTQVHVVVVTDGTMGSTTPTQDLCVVRQEESRRAAAILGYPAPEFWGLPDRGVRFAPNLVSRMCETMGRYKPQLVFAPALSETHPDHQAVALAAIEALRRLVGSEQTSTFESAEVWFYEVSSPQTPNRLIDISAVELIKQRAIQCFESQLALQSYDEQIAGLNRFRSYSLGNQVRSAEAFFSVKADALSTNWLFQSALTKRMNTQAAIDPSELPLISVVMDLRGEELLPSTLESLAAQGYPNLEFLLVLPESKRGSNGHNHSAEEQFKAAGICIIQSLSQVPQRATGALIGLLQTNAVVAPNVLSSVVDLFHQRGPHGWGEHHKVCLDIHSLTFVRSDRWDARHSLTPFVVADFKHKTRSLFERLKRKLKVRQ